MVLPTRYPNLVHPVWGSVNEDHAESAVSINERLKLIDIERREAERDHKSRMDELDRTEREILGLKP